MFCNIIPDQVLKHINDKASLKINRDLKSLKHKIMKLFTRKTLVQDLAEQRITCDTHNSTKLPGDQVANDETYSLAADSYARNAHQATHEVYRFYVELFGRNSLDDNGLTIVSTVHFDKNYNNAFWNGDQLVFGDGDGKYFIPLCKGIDVIGHELTHGVVQNTANLNYFWQSGAANEAFADIFGITIKQRLANQTDPKSANWLIGDTVVGSEFPGKAIRSFKNEKAYSGDKQPCHMRDFVWTFSDSCGVHTNSKILNHFFYQLCMISGLPSWDKPIKLMYNVLLKLNQNSNFWDIARELRKQSASLSLTKEVDQALKAVGL